MSCRQPGMTRGTSEFVETYLSDRSDKQIIEDFGVRGGVRWVVVRWKMR